MSDIMVGGHVVARALAREGVRAVFTLCGGHVAPIYDGCLQGGIAILDTRHEQAAVHAADAYARLTRTAGVAILTAGPGVTDGVTGVANAFQAQVPLVVLGGAAPQRHFGKGALQELEQVSLLRPITKWSATVTRPDRLADMIATAFRVATSGVPGPVFLELPFDVLTAQVENPVFPEPSRPTSRAALDPDGALAAARLLDAAERPLLFVGSQVWWDDATNAVRELADRHQLPVYANAMARGVLPAGHPLSFALSRKDAFRRADLVVVVGTPLDFRTGYGADIPGSARIVQIDRDAAKIGQNRAVEVGIVGDAVSNLAAIDAALDAHQRTKRAGWVEELRGHEAKRRATVDKFAHDDARPINHYRFARALAEAIDDDTLLVGDGGDVVAAAAKVVPLAAPGRWLDPGPLGCLGIGAPFALAAKWLHPSKKVLVVSGDGSFGLNGFDFESCVRHRLPVVCVVGNDAAWGQIRGPQLMLFGPDRAPATKLAPTRYDRIVEAMGGGRGAHVEDPAELAPAIRQALASGETCCVDVALEPDFMVRSGDARLTV